jgi:ABC-type glycerol-3-phosphate transport system permease component
MKKATVLRIAFPLALLVVGAVGFIMPLLIMVFMALKTPAEIAHTSPWEPPKSPTLANFSFLLNDPTFNFPRKALNTLLLCVVPTIGITLSSALTAYPFARINFRCRDKAFILLLSTMMLPGAVTLIPGYVLYARLGWIDTFYPFLIPAFLGGGAFNIFLVRQFMRGIPTEMDEAAILDGASHGRIFSQIVLPNCKPVLATIAIFTLVGTARDFLGPSLILNSPERQTIEVGLRGLQTAHTTDWNYLMAGSLLVFTPIFLMFVFFQKFFMKGIALTGGK